MKTMNKIFSLFAVLLITLSINPVHAPSHPEPAPDYYPPPYKECLVSDTEKAAVLEALFNYNASWKNYPIMNLTNLYCYYASLYPEPFYREAGVVKPLPTAQPAVSEATAGEVVAGSSGSAPVVGGVVYPDDYPPSPPETTKNIKYVSGTLELRKSSDTIKFISVYFVATIDEGNVKIQSAYEQENYDFERFFSKEENEKLDYFLKKLIIDLSLGDTQDKGIWISLQRTYYPRPLPLEETKAEAAAGVVTGKAVAGAVEPARIWQPPEMNCSEQKKVFDDFVSKIGAEEKFFFEQPYWCLGVFKVKLSSVRSLVKELPENYMLSYYGDMLRFSYSGEAKMKVDLNAVIAKLKEEGCVVISNNVYPEEIIEKKCVAYFNDRAFNFYFNKQYGVSAFGDNVYGDANLWGYMGGKGTLNVYLSGEKADAYASIFEQELESALKSAGIEVDVKLERKEEKYEPKPCILIYPPPPGCEPLAEGESDVVVSTGSAVKIAGVASSEVSEGRVVAPSPVIVRSSYVYYTFSQEVAIPNNAPNWESEEAGNSIYYRNGNAGVMITKAYMSINRYSDNDYWYAEFTDDSVRTSVILDEFNIEKAKQALSASVEKYVAVSADAWKVDYYPMGGGPVIYYALAKSVAAGVAGVSGTAVSEAGGAAAQPVEPPAPAQAAVEKAQERAQAVASEAQDFQQWVKEEAQKEEEQKFTVQKFFDGIWNWIVDLFR